MEAPIAVLANADIFLDYTLKWPHLDEKEIIAYVKLIPNREQAILTLLEWCCQQAPSFCFAPQQWPFHFTPEDVYLYSLRLVVTYAVLVSLASVVGRESGKFPSRLQ